MASIPWIAVGIGTVGYQVLGALWYGPVFGSTWMDAMGLVGDERGSDLDPKLGYLLTGIGSFIATVTMAILVDWSGITTVQDGLMLGLLCGIGLVATTALQAVPFEGRDTRIYALNVGYNLVALAGIGALLAWW